MKTIKCKKCGCEMSAMSEACPMCGTPTANAAEVAMQPIPAEATEKPKERNYKTTEELMEIVGYSPITMEQGYAPFFTTGWACGFPVVPSSRYGEVMPLIEQHNQEARALGIEEIRVIHEEDDFKLLEADTFLNCNTDLGKFAYGFACSPPRVGLFGKNKALVKKQTQVQPLKDKIISLCEVYWTKDD